MTTVNGVVGGCTAIPLSSSTSLASSGSWSTTPTSVTGPSPDSHLASHLADSTVVPSGFLGGGIDSGLVGAGGLGSAGRHWARPLVGGGEDTISLFVTRFASAAKAIDFNAGFAQEYASGRLVRHDAIPGVPGANAYLYAPYPQAPGSATSVGTPSSTTNDATAWFTVGPIAVGVYVVDRTEDPLAVAEALAQAQFRLLA